MEKCISCGIELSKMENNRSECWECMDKTNESYHDE
jgi:hypothetical protein